MIYDILKYFEWWHLFLLSIFAFLCLFIFCCLFKFYCCKRNKNTSNSFAVIETNESPKKTFNEYNYN
jgi:hypothetical protein